MLVSVGLLMKSCTSIEVVRQKVPVKVAVCILCYSRLGRSRNTQSSHLDASNPSTSRYELTTNVPLAITFGLNVWTPPRIKY